MRWKQKLHFCDFSLLFYISLSRSYKQNHYNSFMDSTSAGEKTRVAGGTEYSWCRAAVGGTGTTVLALLLSRPIPTQNLQNALTKLQNFHPVLGAKLRCPPDNGQPEISVSSAVSPVSLVVSETPVADLHAALELALNDNPWAEGGPDPKPVFFASSHAVTGGKSAVTLRIHTVICDRTASVHVLKDLMAILVNNEDAEGICGGQDGVGSPIEDLISKQDTWKPFWARGKDLMGYTVNGLRSTPLRFEVPGRPVATECVRLILDRDLTRKLLDACEKREIKLYAVLSAAMLIAAHSSNNIQNNQKVTYSVVTLVDCRKNLQPVLEERHVGFYHSAVLNMHTLQGSEDLWELARRCHDALTTAKKSKKHLTDINDLNFLMCKAIDNPQMTPSSSLRTGIITVFEDPVIYESSEMQRQLGVEDFIGCASVHGVGPSIGIFETIRDGELDCAILYPSPLHSRKQMEELEEHSRKLLTEGSKEV